MGRARSLAAWTIKITGTLILWSIGGFSLANGLVVEEIHPQTFEAGDILVLGGNFTDVDSAAVVFVSEENIGVPLEVVSLSDHEIVGRSSRSAPWPIMGSVHVLSLGTPEVSQASVLDRPGYQVQSSAYWQEVLQSAASPGGLWLSGTDVNGGLKSVSRVVGGELRISEPTTCSGERKTARFTIESAPGASGTEEPDCPSLHLTLTLRRIEVTASPSPFENLLDLRDAFHQSFEGVGAQMTILSPFEVAVGLESCSIQFGTVAFQCP